MYFSRVTEKAPCDWPTQATWSFQCFVDTQVSLLFHAISSTLDAGEGILIRGIGAAPFLTSNQIIPCSTLGVVGRFQNT